MRCPNPKCHISGLNPMKDDICYWCGTILNINMYMKMDKDLPAETPPPRDPTPPESPSYKEWVIQEDRGSRYRYLVQIVPNRYLAETLEQLCRNVEDNKLGKYVSACSGCLKLYYCADEVVDKCPDCGRMCIDPYIPF